MGPTAAGCLGLITGPASTLCMERHMDARIYLFSFYDLSVCEERPLLFSQWARPFDRTQVVVPCYLGVGDDRAAPISLLLHTN